MSISTIAAMSSMRRSNFLRNSEGFVDMVADRLENSLASRINSNRRSSALGCTRNLWLGSIASFSSHNPLGLQHRGNTRTRPGCHASSVVPRSVAGLVNRSLSKPDTHPACWLRSLIERSAVYLNGTEILPKEDHKNR